jgi:tRNA U34 5-carboxymethylaminomethyl modifying enzyme MnmG/GidA
MSGRACRRQQRNDARVMSSRSPTRAYLRSDKEKKLYVEAVRMLKLRLSDAEAKVKDFAAKRGMFENEIERLSEWCVHSATSNAERRIRPQVCPQPICACCELRVYD